MKKIKVKLCENFIKKLFKKIPENGGITTNCFWKSAIEAGLWDGKTFGGPMSEALQKLTYVEYVYDDNGHYLYSVFRLK